MLIFAVIEKALINHRLFFLFLAKDEKYLLKQPSHILREQSEVNNFFIHHYLNLNSFRTLIFFTSYSMRHNSCKIF